MKDKRKIWLGYCAIPEPDFDDEPIEVIYGERDNQHIAYIGDMLWHTRNIDDETHR